MTAVSGSAATATLTLNLTLEEADVLAQALDLLASDPSRTAVRPLTSAKSPVDIGETKFRTSTGDEWPNIEVSRTDDNNPELAALGYAAFDLSSRVHDLINAANTPSWAEGLRVAMGR